MPPLAPKLTGSAVNRLPNQSMGSFGYRTSGPVGSTNYMQNPVMSGAGMPRALPQQPQGGDHPLLPMYEPRGTNARVR